jgi:myosin-5
MIEGKLGVLGLLDEESRMPAGTDQGWCNKLFTQLGTEKHKKWFTKPRFSNSAFTISHYAHDVTYDCDGFLEKNRDTLPDELLNLIKNSDNEFLEEILMTSATISTGGSVSFHSSCNGCIRFCKCSAKKKLTSLNGPPF